MFSEILHQEPSETLVYLVVEHWVMFHQNDFKAFAILYLFPHNGLDFTITSHWDNNPVFPSPGRFNIFGKGLVILIMCFALYKYRLFLVINWRWWWIGKLTKGKVKKKNLKTLNIWRLDKASSREYRISWKHFIHMYIIFCGKYSYKNLIYFRSLVHSVLFFNHEILFSFFFYNDVLLQYVFLKCKT